MTAFAASLLSASVVTLLPFGLTTVVGAVTAAWIDARTGRLPDLWIGITAVGAVGIAASTAEGWLGPSIGTALVAGPLLVAHVVSPTAVGFGDVKLAIALGPALGAVGPVAPLVALWFATAIGTVVGLIRRSPAVALGPGLVTGGVLALGLARWSGT